MSISGLWSRVGRNNVDTASTAETGTADVETGTQCLLTSPSPPPSPTVLGANTSGSASGGTLREVALLTVGWYVAAIACITSSKRVLLAVPFPLLLCLAQFAMSASLGGMLHLSGFSKYVHKHNKHKHKGEGEEGVVECRSLSKSEQGQLDGVVKAIALSYCLGFVCTNMSFSLVSANFAETIKAGEPLSSVLLGYVVLRQAYSASSYGCLLVVCLGVSLSCVGTDDFSTWGFLFAGEWVSE